VSDREELFEVAVLNDPLTERWVSERFQIGKLHNTINDWYV
jgi:hypothetical protein